MQISGVGEKITVEPDFIHCMCHLSYRTTKRALDGIERTEGDSDIHPFPLQSKRYIGDLPRR